MQDKEEGISKGEDEFGVLCSGRRYKKSITIAEEREKHSEYPEHRISIYITQVQQIEGEEEDIQFSPVIEESVSPSRAKVWVETTTSCASPEYETMFEYLTREIVINRGSMGKNNQSNSSNTINQNQTISLGRGPTLNNMVGVDNTLILLEFKGIGSKELEQHMFVCETIWTTNNIHDDDAKVAQL
jgi:hypothetical protein